MISFFLFRTDSVCQELPWVTGTCNLVYFHLFRVDLVCQERSLDGKQGGGW